MNILHKGKIHTNDLLKRCGFPADPSRLSNAEKVYFLGNYLVDALEKLDRLNGPQKPLPLDEFSPGGVERYPDVVWIEFKGEHIIDVWTPRNSGEDFILWYGQIKEKDQYNKTWRCWASKPTDEECKAAPWED